MTDKADHDNLLMLTSEIVSSHLANNQMAAEEIPQLIKNIYGTLANVAEVPEVVAERPQPAVSIKKSITPDYIVCLEDGKKLKMLKRHLKTSYDMSPDQYRERWGLPSDYPMVAPSYARQRSKLAKEIGLGTTRRNSGRKRKAA